MKVSLQIRRWGGWVVTALAFLWHRPTTTQVLGLGDLRAILTANPELAIVLVLHLK